MQLFAMDCFDSTHLRLLYFAGAEIDENGNFFGKLWPFVYKILAFSIIYVNIGGFIQMTIYIKDFPNFLAAFLVFNFTIHPIIYDVIFAFKKKKILQLYHLYIQNLEESKSNIFDMKKEFYDVIVRESKQVKFRLIMMLGNATIVFIMFLVSNILWGYSELPSFTWNPLDITWQPAYLITWLLQYLSTSSGLLMIGGKEVVLATYIRLQIVHAQFLIKHLENIQEMADTQPRIAEKNLDWWIRQHQLYLKNENELRQLFSPMLLLNYFVIFMFFFSAAVLLISPSYEMSLRVGTLVGASIYLFGFRRLCVLSDDQKEMNLHYFKSGFTTSSIINGQKIAKAFLLIHTRNTRYRQIAAFGLYPLSMESFGILLKATFTYIVTAIQLQQTHH